MGEGVLILTEGTANSLRPPHLEIGWRGCWLAGSVGRLLRELVGMPPHPPRPTSWHRVEHDGTSEWLLPKVPPFILIAFRLPSQPHATLQHFQSRLLSSPFPSHAVSQRFPDTLTVIFVTLFASICVYIYLLSSQFSQVYYIGCER